MFRTRPGTAAVQLGFSPSRILTNSARGERQRHLDADPDLTLTALTATESAGLPKGYWIGHHVLEANPDRRGPNGCCVSTSPIPTSKSISSP